MHDGRRGGRLAELILSGGSLDFSRIQGAKPEIVSLVEAEFPRDRATQELFFLEAYEESGRPSEDGEGGEPGEDLRASPAANYPTSPLPGG